MTTTDYVTLAFEIVSLLVVATLGILLLAVLSRQRRELLHTRRLMNAMAQYAAVQEGDGRATRRAVADIAETLQIRAAAAALTDADESMEWASAVERIHAVVRREERRVTDE